MGLFRLSAPVELSAVELELKYWRNRLANAMSSVAELQKLDEALAIKELVARDGVLTGMTLSLAQELTSLLAEMWDAALLMGPALERASRLGKENHAAALSALRLQTVTPKIRKVGVMERKLLRVQAAVPLSLDDYMTSIEHKFERAQALIVQVSRAGDEASEAMADVKQRLEAAGRDAEEYGLPTLLSLALTDPVAAREALHALTVELVKDLSLCEQCDEQLAACAMHLEYLQVSAARQSLAADAISDLVAWLDSIRLGAYAGGRCAAALHGLSNWSSLAQRAETWLDAGDIA